MACFDIFPKEWQSFVDSSGEDGIVVLALGTLINDELTDEQVENIATSLSLLPQKAAWSYGGTIPKTLGNNTKVAKWIPQNDLLGKRMVQLLFLFLFFFQISGISPFLCANQTYLNTKYISLSQFNTFSRCFECLQTEFIILS